MRHGVSGLVKNLTYAKLVAMNSTQELAAAGIRYRLYIGNKSQRWLSKQLGWEVSKLARRLSGKPAFKVDELDTIAEILGIDFAELLSIPADAQQKFFCSPATELDLAREEQRLTTGRTPVGKAA